MLRPSLPLGALALLAHAACRGDRLPAPALTSLTNPAPATSSAPGLTISPGGTTTLSWLERGADSTFSLHFARRDTSGHWTAATPVGTGATILASAGDVPTVSELPGGILAAAWRSPPAAPTHGEHSHHGYDILVSHSPDQGASWSAPGHPHRDGTTTEHGFVSWLQLGTTSGMVWVDGRGNANPDSAQRATRLAFAAFDPTGAVLPETFVDERICDCCHTSAAAVPGGAVVAYRDRRPGEIRDISTIRWAGGTWRVPVSVHDDHWQINGCPVNGPALAARGAEVAVAWFTAANDTARVRVAFSTDTATTFGAPIEVNDTRADGRVGIVLTAPGEVIVSWIERRKNAAWLRVRRVRADGTRSPAVDVASFGEAKRAGGMPKLLLGPDGALLAWTDATTDRVTTALLH